jgi:hypothetical protein
MTGNRLIAGIIAALAALGATLAVSPAQARPAVSPAQARPAASPAQAPSGIGPTAISGYIWSGDTNGYYAYDSTGRAATIEGDGTGSYFAIFPGLQDIKDEHVDVSTYAAGAACLLEGTQALTSALFISIDCYSAAGALANGAFDVAVTHPTRSPAGVFDYDLVPAARSGKLTGAGQYNSAGKTNTVEHLSTGKYQVTMPGQESKGVAGVAQVTDIDHGGVGRCELAGWQGTKTGEVVDVDCFSLTGARQNRSFSVGYIRNGNLLGLDGITSAIAYANRPAATVYQPADQHDSARGASVVVIRLSKGNYLVMPAGSSGPAKTNGGNVAVNAVGSSGNRCYVGGWSQANPPQVNITCVNGHGKNADSAFTVEWTVA